MLSKEEKKILDEAIAEYRDGDTIYVHSLICKVLKTTHEPIRYYPFLNNVKEYLDQRNDVLKEEGIYMKKALPKTDYQTRAVVDEIGKSTVLLIGEDENRIVVPNIDGVKEGDILEISINILKEETEKARTTVKDLENSLFV